MGQPLDVLLVEPYYAGSHRAWADGLVAHTRHRVRLVSHEGTFWRWRLRGGALTLAEAIGGHVRSCGRPDAVVVSDMVDLPALLGLTRRTLGDVPVALYLHENQVTYPLGPTQSPDEALSLVNWLSLAAADVVWFNSAFHRDSLLGALPDLLARAPDRSHAHRLSDVVARCSVLPVGVDVADLVHAPRPAGDGPPLVLWNQRWDHDKAPARFFRCLTDLAAEGVDFRVAVCGANERVDPQEFDRARRDLGDRVTSFGWLPRDEYLDLLLRADVVLSTARQEFFGIAMVEAMAGGAVPLLPDGLSYPGLLPESAHAAVLYRDDEVVDRLRTVLTDLGAARDAIDGLRTSMERFDWRVVAPLYDEAIVDLVSRFGRADD